MTETSYGAAGRGDPTEAPGEGRERLSIIHLVRSDAFAGVERYICQVANGLADRGHRVAVIGGERGRMRAELGTEVSHRTATTVIGATWSLVDQPRSDVVHVHMTAAEIAAWLARPLRRAPVVATRHFPGGRGAGWPARMLAAVSARAVARDIAISRYVAAGVDAPSELLYNGVADQGQAPLTSPTVLMLQRLTPEKSPEVGLRAWAASGLARDGWRLVIAGSGSLAPSLTALADDLGVTRSVEFPGQLADTDAVIADSSILLATAPDEPFGLSVVEAMSHGLAVVAADGGAHVETVGDEGALFAPGDVDAAARALRSLAEDAATRSRMGDRLRRRQQRLFSLARHLDRLEEIYGQVVADARGRGSGR